jgi:phosphomannomutase
MEKLTCFKAYDIRGKLGEELNEEIAWRIGRAYGEYLKPQTIVLGGDVRLTSESLKLALAKGLQDAGVDVLDIGLSGTEEIYFATFHLGVDGGIEVTASHNPMDYNGMKLVRQGARPISGDTGLRDVQRLAEANDFPPVNEGNKQHRVHDDRRAEQNRFVDVKEAWHHAHFADGTQMGNTTAQQQERQGQSRAHAADQQVVIPETLQVNVRQGSARGQRSLVRREVSHPERVHDAGDNQ